MGINTLSSKNLNNLNVLVRELLIGPPISTPIIPMDVAISLGDNIIKFLALLLCNQQLRGETKKGVNSNLEGYITDMLSDQRGIDIGLAIAIVRDISEVDAGQRLVEQSADFGESIDKWIKIRKAIRGVKSFKELGIKYRNDLMPVVESFYDNAIVIRSDSFNQYKTFANGIETGLLEPFFIVNQCPRCSGSHLFAFDSYNEESSKYHYKCWGNRHDFIVEVGSFEKNGNAHIDLLNTKRESGKSTDRHASYLPLFESSYPSMKKLVELLYDKTEFSTKKKLWAFSHLAGGDAASPEFIKNKILLDCIEHGPIAVIRDVASLEGASELPGYVRELLRKGGKKNIEEEISILESKCEKNARERYALLDQPLEMPDDDPEMIRIRDEVYSIAVAELLGFHIQEMENISHLEYYRHKIDKAITYYSKNEIRPPDCKKESKKIFYELEIVYKELVYFYQYVFANKMHEESTPSYKIGPMSDFIQLHYALVKIHQEFSSIRNKKEEEKFEELFGKRKDSQMRPAIFDMAAYERILRISDESGSLIDFNIALYSNSNSKYLKDTKEAYIEILKWIKEIFDFFLDKRTRIFPFKILFTVSSEIRPFSDLSHAMRGIKTCQYFTYLMGEEMEQKGKAMKIYTSQPIDFLSYYYCLPHHNRSLDNIWVDPLLLSVKEVGYKDRKEGTLNENDSKKYEKSEPYIFISYARSDIARIRPDLELLTNQKFRWWYDSAEEGIPLGKNWPRFLKEKIRNCDQFVIYISKQSNMSDYVMDELLLAIEFKKNIIPIVLDDMLLDEKNEHLRRFIDVKSNNGIFKFNFENYENYTSKLLKGLASKCKAK